MELLHVQTNIKKNLQRSRAIFKNSPKEKFTVSYIETRLQTIDAKWTEFTSNHYKLLQISELSRSSYFQESVYEDTEEFYIDFKSELRELIEKQTIKPDNEDYIHTVCSGKSNVKLPKITIPVFSGKYTEWTTFRDLFTSLIHNDSSLDDVQKLHYLKGHMTGEAEQLLRHIPITKDNYSQCWSTLENRYDNRQFLVNSILHAFFNKKKIITESASAIKDLLNCTLDMLNGVKSLSINTEAWDILIIYIVSLKLDQESRKLWESRVSDILSDSNCLPNFTQFKTFLEKRFRSLEFLDTKADDVNKAQECKRGQAIIGNNSEILSMFCVEESCTYCKGSHKLSDCKEFLEQEYIVRRKFVEANRLCYNCLKGNHSAKYCRNSTRCGICNGRHHSLLHQTPPKQSLSQNSKNFIRSNFQHVLLPTAVVATESNKCNNLCFLRSLIDQGSQSSFITQEVVNQLGMKTISCNNTVTSLGKGESIILRSFVNLSIRSRINPRYVRLVKAYVVEKITSVLPTTNIGISWPALNGVKLADPKFNQPNTIDILLGAEVYSSIIRDGLIRSPSGTTVAQNTALGWIVSGGI